MGSGDGSGVGVSDGTSWLAGTGGFTIPPPSGVFATPGVGCCMSGVRVGVTVNVGEGVSVPGSGVLVGVAVGVSVGKGVAVSPGRGVGVHVGVNVTVGVGVQVGVAVRVAVPVDVGKTTGVDVTVGVGGGRVGSQIALSSGMPVGGELAVAEKSRSPA